MRFKLKYQERLKHTEIVSCVGWSGTNDVWSISDDNTIWKWDAQGEPEQKIMDIDFNVLAMDWYPNAKGSNEVLAVACADGSFKLISKAGRVDKNVPDAH